VTAIINTAASFPADNVSRSALIRGDHDEYRYELRRTWDLSLPLVVFVMLNPSTADALKDDATIRKCMRFAWMWNYGGIVVVNLFAWRATNPKTVAALPDQRRIGFFNDDFIEAAVTESGSQLTVCAWGAQAFARPRATVVTEMLHRVCLIPPRCLRLSAKGDPWHPLYVPYATELLNF